MWLARRSGVTRIFRMSAVSDALKNLLNRIQPTGGEMQAAERHFATIKGRLETVFAAKKFAKVGSFSRGTYIRGRMVPRTGAL